jgi:acyl-CoA thioester hydrolase
MSVGGSDGARVVRHRVRPAYGDTDQSGIVHHAVYLRWLEEARTTYLRDAGLDFRELEQGQRIGVAVARAEIRYIRPARFDDDLVVEAWVGKLGGAQMRFDYRVSKGEELLLEAEITLACIDLVRMRAIRIPPAIRSCCDPSVALPAQ